MSFLLLSLTFLFGSATLIALVIPCRDRPAELGRERYDPRLRSVDSVNAAENYVRGRVGPRATQAEVAAAIEDFAARRFQHNFSGFSFCRNWVAHLAGAMRYDLKVPIDPDDILKQPSAMCSQNAMVVQALLERFAIDFATVKFVDEHMAVAARIGNDWVLYDGDLEIARNSPVILDSPDVASAIELAYRQRTSLWQPGDPADMARHFARLVQTGQVTMESVNVRLGWRGEMLQRVEWYFSWFGWLLFLVSFLALKVLRAKRRSPQARPAPVPVSFSSAVPAGGS